MNIKKIFAIIAFIIFIIGMAFALYWVFFRSISTAPIDDNNNFQPGNLPGIGSGTSTVVDGGGDGNVGLPWEDYFDGKVSKIANGGPTAVTRVVENNVNGVTDGNFGLQYYDEVEQKFYRINEEGRPVVLSDKKFYQVDNVTWDNSGEKAIIEYPDGSNIVYDFRTNKQVTLPAEMEEFSFNSAGNQIVAEWQGGSDENNWIISSNYDGSSKKLIEPLGDQAHNTQIEISPDNQVAALYRKYVDAQRQEVVPIGFNDENYKSFVVNGAGFTSKWSNDGESLIYSVYNSETNYNPNLWVTSGDTGDLGDIKVSLNLQTWPEKCTFTNNNSVICAVPQGLERGAGLFPESANEYPDNFYSVNLDTGAKTLLASPVGQEGRYSAQNLFVSNDGTTLYFTDINTGKLQSIQLR